jgi:DNA modification methylase
MPESVTDRPTKSHEYVFLLSKSASYFYDVDAVREPHKPDGRYLTTAPVGDASHQNYKGGNGHERWPNGGRNKRSVWTIATKPYSGAHFATMPETLVEPCVLAGSKPGDTVLDPFGGAGTTGLVANKWGRNAILCELNPEYVKIIESRIAIGLGEVDSDRKIEEKDPPTSSLAGLLGFDGE